VTSTPNDFSQTSDIPPLVADGLGDVLALDWLIKNLTALKEERLGRIKPSFAPHFAALAKDVLVIGDLQKTVPAKDGACTAQIQMRSKAAKAGLDAKGVMAFTKARIPLRLIPSRTVINAKYTVSNDDLTPVVARLTKLVTDHPEAGIPIDLFARTEPVSLPSEDALLRALRLPVAQLQDVIPYLVDFAITKGEADAATKKKVYAGIRIGKPDKKTAVA